MARLVLNLTDTELILLTKVAASEGTDAVTLVRRWINLPPVDPTTNRRLSAEFLADGRPARRRKGPVRVTEPEDMTRGSLG